MRWDRALADLCSLAVGITGPASGTVVPTADGTALHLGDIGDLDTGHLDVLLAPPAVVDIPVPLTGDAVIMGALDLNQFRFALANAVVLAEQGTSWWRRGFRHQHYLRYGGFS